MNDGNDGRISIGRRGFLYVIASSAALIAGAGVVFRRVRHETGATPFLAVLDDLDGARKLGAGWLASNPGRANASDVVADLRNDLGLESRAVPPEELRRLLADRIRGEYAGGQVGKIGNWTLSKTEVRLCVLAALTAPGERDNPG
jgi:hypothetical protein